MASLIHHSTLIVNLIIANRQQEKTEPVERRLDEKNLPFNPSSDKNLNLKIRITCSIFCISHPYIIEIRHTHLLLICIVDCVDLQKWLNNLLLIWLEIIFCKSCGVILILHSTPLRKREKACRFSTSKSLNVLLPQINKILWQGDTVASVEMEFITVGLCEAPPTSPSAPPSAPPSTPPIVFLPLFPHLAMILPTYHIF
jgi:hypothetical protein